VAGKSVDVRHYRGSAPLPFEVTRASTLERVTADLTRRRVTFRVVSDSGPMTIVIPLCPEMTDLNLEFDRSGRLLTLHWRATVL